MICILWHSIRDRDGAIMNSDLERFETGINGLTTHVLQKTNAFSIKNLDVDKSKKQHLVCQQIIAL